MSSPTTHPRRRLATTSTQPKGVQTRSHLTAKACATHVDTLNLKKGSTFHSPTSPSTPNDPSLDIRNIPTRSPTCPETLEKLVATHEKRVANLIDSIALCNIGRGSKNSSIHIDDFLPVPEFLVAHAASNSVLMDVDNKSKTSKYATAAGQSDHQHQSDSGLGSSVSGESTCTGPTTTQKVNTGLFIAIEDDSFTSADHYQAGDPLSRTSVYSPIVNPTSSPIYSHNLSPYAIKKIKLHIIDPILAESKLKDYHPLVRSIPNRIADRVITTLRDLEKTLIFLAPVSTNFLNGESTLAHCFLRAKSSAKSPASYLSFGETSIQCIHTTVDHLNEQDQRRPTDRPYTNKYFLDLVGQVRQYAHIMAVSRQKKATGKTPDKMDYSTDEKLSLRGGIAENGKSAELVREKKDGTIIPLNAEMSPTSTETEDMTAEDVQRSMARKRKCDIGKEEWRACRECGKEFKRPCDLTKHEKTHSRPWKCPEPGCRYADLGWPTEKERDRHNNDKHSAAPAMYSCLFASCAYTSKRESNCKQHMEKSHGWTYVRSKSKKGELVTSSGRIGSIQLMPTPSSIAPTLSEPASPWTNSPAYASSNALSPEMPVDTPVIMDNTSDDTYNMTGSTNQAFGFEDFGGGLPAYQLPLSPMDSDGRPSLATPGSAYNGTLTNSSVPSSAYLADFDYGPGNEDSNWPSIPDFFSGTQYPDADGRFDFATGSGSKTAKSRQQMSPGAQEDIMFADPEAMYFQNTDEGFVGSDLEKHSGDFQLFGESGESSTMGAMFPELGDTIGGQFSGDSMFDAMNTDNALNEYTNYDDMVGQ